MRLWSLHPRFLDSKGLVALWREGLLARKVLEGKTKGYRHHPQLVRFRTTERPQAALEAYLFAVLEEAEARGFRFDRDKLEASWAVGSPVSLPVTVGQLAFEWQHLLNKLELRDPPRYAELITRPPEPHPLFTVKAGEIEPWERTS